MSYVLDASVLASYLLRGPAGEGWKRLSAAGVRPAAPDWAYIEISSALWKAVRKGLDADEAVGLLTQLRRLAIDWHPAEPLVPRAFSLAVKTGCTPYDGIYLALAFTLNGTLVTADRKLIDYAKSYPGLAISWEDLDV